MSTHRCNHCDFVYDSQKPTSGTVLVDNHAASDCPQCGGQAHQARALLPHHKIVDHEYRAIPDPKVLYVPPLPMASETYQQVQELISKLQGQLAAESKRGDEMQRSLDKLAAMPLRPSPAAVVVEAQQIPP